MVILKLAATNKHKQPQLHAPWSFMMIKLLPSTGVLNMLGTLGCTIVEERYEPATSVPPQYSMMGL